MLVRQGMKDETSRKLRADLRDADERNDDLRSKLILAYRWIKEHMWKHHDEHVDPQTLVTDDKEKL